MNHRYSSKVHAALWASVGCISFGIVAMLGGMAAGNFGAGLIGVGMLAVGVIAMVRWLELAERETPDG